MKACEACGVEFEPSRKTQRFHAPACRERARYVPKSTKPKTPVSVEAATLRTLEAAGAVESPLGQTALVLAARLDVAGESGATLAQLAKELRASLEAATKAGSVVADPVERAKSRRAQRLRLVT